MAHIDYDTTPIIINIPDNTLGIKRKAQLNMMVYHQQNKRLSLNWNVIYFKNNSGEYGDIVNERGITSYNMENIANNTVIVNANTGEILTPDSDGNYPDDINTMGQYDWFYMMAKTNALNVHDMIISYGTNATWD